MQPPPRSSSLHTPPSGEPDKWSDKQAICADKQAICADMQATWSDMQTIRSWSSLDLERHAPPLETDARPSSEPSLCRHAEKLRILSEISHMRTELTAIQREIEVELNKKTLPEIPGLPAGKARGRSSPLDDGRQRSQSALLGCEMPTRTRKMSTMDELQQRRIQMLTIGKKKFNLSPAKGIQFLADQQFFSSNPPGAEDVARFLLVEGDMLSKFKLGEFLGEPDAFNIAVLDYFVKFQDFTDTTLDCALRKFLKTFRLPGEAQKIDRMMERFARRYSECNQTNPYFQDPDTAYILAFSIIMLNTDLHNPAIKRKMKKDDFIRNNLSVLASATGDRTSDDKSRSSAESLDRNVPSKLLTAIYTSIQQDPLSLPSLSQGNDDDPLHNDPFNYTFFNPERNGWLVKQGGRIKTWKRRYAILTDNCFYYFKECPEKYLPNKKRSRASKSSTSSIQPCGIIPLENLRVKALDDDQHATPLGPLQKPRYFFKLFHPEDEELERKGRKTSFLLEDEENASGEMNLFIPKVIKAAKSLPNGKIVEGRHRYYLFYCETKDERDDWVYAIRAQMAQPPVYALYHERRKRFE